MNKVKLLAALFVIGFPLSASANIWPPTKFLDFIWWPSHWRDQDYQPYYETAPDPHNSQWDDNKLSDTQWTPKDWIDLDGGSPEALVKKWYVADIIREQHFANRHPYITVGPNFYHLGGADKHRVMETLDAIYMVTARSQAHAFDLQDFRTDRVVGIYSKNGLDLQ